MLAEERDFHILMDRLGKFRVYKDAYTGVPVNGCELMRRVDKGLLRSDPRIARCICGTLKRAGLPKAQIERFKRALRWRSKFLSILHRVN